MTHAEKIAFLKEFEKLKRHTFRQLEQFAKFPELPIGNDIGSAFDIIRKANPRRRK